MVSSEDRSLLPESNSDQGGARYSEDISSEEQQQVSESDLSSSDSMISLSNLEDIADSINPHRSFFYVFMLAVIVGGLQLSWCTEFSEGTPYLLSLGVSKHTLALIWIAGPLSGSLGQPIIGIFSDKSQNKSGRRSNYIIWGCFSTSLSLFYLSYSLDLVSIFFPKSTERDAIKAVTIPFAALGVYLLDFSISAIQAASRAYIVDNVPTHQQQIANAMAAVLIGAFNIIGYFLGSIDLVKHLSLLGNTQFKILATIASLTLIVSSTASLLFIKERDPTTDVVIKAERKRNLKRLKKLGIESTSTLWSTLRSLYSQTTYSIKRLSPQVKTVCYAEFFAWIGYFPMLFYTTTYVGELFIYEFFQSRSPGSPPLSEEELQWLKDEATRKGSLALLLHSISSFLIDLILPLLVQPFDSTSQSEDRLLSSSLVGDVLEKIRRKYTWWLTVRNSWYLSHLLFIACMSATFLIRSSTAAIALFAVLGITWGNALWAPFVLISEEVSRIKEVKAKIQKERSVSSSSQNGNILSEVTAEKFENYEHEAGIILGLHNFFVAAPQVISSLLSSVLFKILSKGDTNQGEYDSSLGWVFRFGGVATIGALILSLKVKSNEELEKEQDQLLQVDV